MRQLQLVLAILVLGALSACGGGSSGNGGGNSPPPPPPPPADFKLVVSPSTVGLSPGGQEPVTVSITPLNGFTGQVDVTITGVPAEVTASTTSFTLASGAESPVQFSAPSTAVGLSTTLTMTGVSGALTHEQSVPLVVSLAVTAAHPAIRARYIRTDSFYNPNALQFAPPHFTVYDARDKRFFVSNPFQDRIDVFDATQEVEIGKIVVPSAWGLDISPDDTKIYAGTLVGDIYQIDPALMQVVTRTPTASIGPSGFQATEAFLLSNGDLALLGGTGGLGVDGYLDFAIWNPTNNTLVDNNTTGACFIGNVGAFAVSGDRTKILAAGISSENLCSYDTNTSQGTVKLFSADLISEISPTPDGKRFFVTSESGAVGVFDASTLQQLGTFQAAASPGIYGAMMSRDGTKLYAIDSGNHLLAYDTTSFAAVGWVPNYKVVDLQETIVPGAMDETGLIVGPIGHGVSFVDGNQLQPMPVAPNLGLGFITPDTGPAAGGTAVQVPTDNASEDETTFPSLTAAYLGNAALVNASVTLSNAFPPIVGTTPPASTGTVADVAAVFSNKVVSIMPEAFSYGPAIVEVVSNAAPSSGAAIGAVVGYGFGQSPADVQVTVGGKSAPVTELFTNPPIIPYPYSVETLVFKVPSGAAGPADITVSTANGSTTATGAFHYSPALTSYPLPGASLQAGVYDPHRGLYYFTDTAKIQVLSLTSGAWQSAITLPNVGANTLLLGIALSPDGSKLAVADYGDEKIYVLNPTNPSSAQTFMLPQNVDSGLAPCGLVILDNGMVYFATNDVQGDGARGFHSLNTTSGVTSDYPDIGDGAPYDAFIRVFLTPDQSRVFSQIEGIAFSVDTATGNMIEAPSVSVDEGGDPEMTMSADGSTVAVNGYFTDSNLNPFGFLAYADRETWLPAKTIGQKLSMDGSVFFQPLTDGIDLVDVQTGRLVNRVQLPIQLPTVYDSLVMDGADDVVAIITGNGVSTLDLSSEFPAAAVRQRRAGEAPALSRPAARISRHAATPTAVTLTSDRPHLKAGNLTISR